MTETRLLKNFKMASPSSPTAAIATPKTKLKTTRPEIQERKIFTVFPLIVSAETILF
jgi:hypothetical protein